VTIREMLDLMPHGERFSEWVTVTDPTGRFFYGHRDEIPEKVAEMPVGRLKATYVWEADMFVITMHTWRRLSENED